MLTDRRMPVRDGIGLLKGLRAELPAPPPVVVLTGFGTIPEAVEAVRLGAADYLTKPLESPRALLAVVDRLLAPEAPGDEIVTGDARMREVLALVDRVAPADVTVLVTGESGTGKELVARRDPRALAARRGGRSSRSTAAALPETLARERALRARARRVHGRGPRSARAASRRRRRHAVPRRDRRARRPALQAKLLRVLEDRRVRRVGGDARR